MYTLPPADPAVEEMRARLTAPFRRSEIRFKRGAKGKWFPYFGYDTLLDRLNEATGNRWSLEVANWEWRDKNLVVFGHMEIPGLGRRAGLGMQEHTSTSGNEMGADMIKGVRADLTKCCLVSFGCGAQARAMDEIEFDPFDAANRARIRKYLDFYFGPKSEGVPGEKEGLT